MIDDGLLAYYERRVPEFEEIYAIPQRQASLAALRTFLVDRLAGHDVLEVGCGTGYWTAALAPATRSIVATDPGERALAAARAKDYRGARVRIERADAFDLEPIGGTFTAGLAAFLWSHLPRRTLGTFLIGFHARLGRDARVVLADNLRGAGPPGERIDEDGDAYQRRLLRDGTTFEVRKNYYDAAEVAALVGARGRGFECFEREPYWAVAYDVAEGP